MFFTYILKSLRDGELYIGFTQDLKSRVEEHNSGKVFSTRTRKPFKLIYYEAYSDKQDAIKREHNLKLRSRVLAQLKKRLENTLKKL